MNFTSLAVLMPVIDEPMALAAFGMFLLYKGYLGFLEHRKKHGSK